MRKSAGALALVGALLVATQSAGQPLPARIRSAPLTVEQYNNEIATIRALAAARGADARNALAQMFVERSFRALDEGNLALAARYALAGWRRAPSNAPEYRAALAAIMHQAQESHPLEGHTARVRMTAQSDDGSRLFTASWDHTARIWDLASGETLAVLHGHSGELSSVQTRGDRAVTTEGMGPAILWDTNGQQIALLTADYSSVSEVHFDRDGRRVAGVASDGKVYVWDAVDGRRLHMMQGPPLQGSLHFVGNELWVAYGSRIFIWNAETGVASASIELPDNSRLEKLVSGDGARVLLTSSGAPPTIWDTRQRREIARLDGHSYSIGALAISNSGRTIATGSEDGVIRFWDANGVLVHQLTGHVGDINSLTFSRDDEYLVSASDDGSARVWGLRTGREVTALLGHTGPVTHAAFDLEDRRIFTTSADGTARIWPLPLGRERAHWPPEWGQAARFSPDGSLLLMTRERGAHSLRAVADGRLVADFPVRFALTARAIDFDRRSERILMAASEGRISIWGTITGATLHDILLNASPTDAGFLGDGSRLAASFTDGSIRVFDVSSGQSLHTLNGHSNVIADLAFDSAGLRIASASYDGTALIWNVQTGAQLGVLSGHNGELRAIAFGARDTLIATAAVDGTARIWRVPDGRLLATLPHTGPVIDVAFSVDGTRIATASWDGTVRIWNSATGEEIIALRHDSGLTHLAFSADGTRLLAATDNNVVRLWAVDSGRELAVRRGVLRSAFSDDGARIAYTSVDGVHILDVSRLTQSMEELAATACANLLLASGRRFGDVEIAADPLVREVWLRNNNQPDVCVAR